MNRRCDSHLFTEILKMAFENHARPLKLRTTTSRYSQKNGRIEILDLQQFNASPLIPLKTNKKSKQKKQKQNQHQQQYCNLSKVLMP